MPILQINRTKRGVVGADHFEGFGTVLRPCEDPSGVEIPDEKMKAIRLDPSMPKIPASLANRISDLYIAMMGKGAGGGSYVDSSKEVSVVLLRDIETMQKWRVLVPTQEVGGASVAADYEKPLCDIETGEEVKQFPPPGWLHAGSSHSHNTMGAFFSGVDDRNELPVPGVHFVLGKITQKDSAWFFDVAPSIVYHGKRYEHVIEDDGSVRAMAWTDLADFTTEGGEAHANVYNYVSVVTYASRSRGPSGRYLSGEFYWEDYHDLASGGYLSRLRADAGHDRIVSYDIEEITGQLDHASYLGWLSRFDAQVDSVGYYGRDKMVPKPKSPVLAYPEEVKEGDLCHSYSSLPLGVSSKWALVQQTRGSAELTIRLVYPAIGKDTVSYYMQLDPIANPQLYVRCVVIYRALLKSYSKRQRAASRAVVVSTDAVTFSTRGVKASDFTEGEIEQMIGAWASDEGKRSALRVAFHKTMRLYDGRSGR